MSALARTVSVVIPALNEEANLRAAVASTRAALAGRVESYEILLVNDGSVDGTRAIMDSLARDDDRIRVFHHDTSWNLGGVYRQAIAEARLNYLFMTPGDNENPTAAMTAPLDALGQADIVLPYPTNLDERPLPRRVGSRGYTALANLLFDISLPYFNGTVIHRLDLLRSIEIRTNSFAYQTEALAKLVRRGATWVGVPVKIDVTKRKSAALRFRNLRAIGAALVGTWFEERVLRR